MAKTKFFISKEVLYQEYVVGKKSSIQIGKEQGISDTTIRDRLREYSIPRRSSGQKKINIPKEVIKKMYVEDRMSIDAIAKELDVSITPVRKCLKEDNVQARSCNETKKKNIPKEILEEMYGKGMSIKEIAKELEVHRMTITKYFRKYGIEKRGKIYIPKEILEDLYLNKNKSIPQIARKLRVGTSPVWNLLKEYNIPIKAMSEANKKYNFSKEFLYQEYIIKKKTATQIAKEMEVSIQTIINYLKEYKFLVRNPCKKINISKEFLYQEYIIKKKTTTQMGKELGVDKSTILERLHEHEIPVKDRRISRIGFDIEKHKEEIIDLYLNEQQTMKQISGAYNVSINCIYHSLKRWKVKMRPTLFGYKERIKCDDGHLVRSSGERQIDNFLFHNGILHQYEKQIGETRYLCDFYIPSINVYIEYFGLCGIDFYDEKTEKKLKVYEKFGLKLISIFPNENIHNKLKHLIPLCAEKQQTLEVYYL